MLNLNTKIHLIAVLGCASLRGAHDLPTWLSESKTGLHFTLQLPFPPYFVIVCTQVCYSLGNFACGAPLHGTFDCTCARLANGM